VSIDPRPVSPADAPAPPGLDELVVAARGGARDAFDELVRRTYGDVFGLALRLTGDEHDASDVAQEAYLRAYRSIRRFRGDAAFSTWMYRITANCAATLLSRPDRRPHEELDTLAPDGAAMAEARDEHDPQVRSERSAERDRLGAALATLSPGLRAVVVLRDIYDLPHQVIAEELGISGGAAKVRLHRARRQLRAQLDGSGTAAGGGGMTRAV
jgi:RNA polymerase sigma-70 factor (ECF subfamily)